MSLYIETIGEGDDVVLLHGWGMHGGVWAGVSNALAQHYRVHIVDLPGMGFSKPVSPFNLQHIAEALAAELPANAVVLGWSLGGQLAMQLALDHPERVSKLVLVGATPRFVNEADWQHGVAPDVFREFAAQVAKDYHDTMTRFLGLQAFGGESSRTLMRELRDRFFERPMPPVAVLQAALDILLESDLRPVLPRLTLPVLLIHGNRDTLAPVDASHWMAHHLPNARLQIIEGASHAPFLSHPTTFMAATQAFMTHTLPAETAS